MTIDTPSQHNELDDALNAIKNHFPALAVDASLLATIDAITKELDPQFDEILQTEAEHIATDANWARGEGLYLCSIVGGYRKFLSRIVSTVRLSSSDPEAAWHLLASAGLSARQLVGMIASSEMGDAENRAAMGFAVQTDLHCAAAAAGFTLPLPNPDLAIRLSAGAATLPLATTGQMEHTISAIEAGEQAADLSLPSHDLYPLSDALDGHDDTVRFQCHLATQLLQDCTVVAFAEIDSLCLSEHWTEYALAIAAPNTP